MVFDRSFFIIFCHFRRFYGGNTKSTARNAHTKENKSFRWISFHRRPQTSRRIVTVKILKLAIRFCPREMKTKKKRREEKSCKKRLTVKMCGCYAERERKKKQRTKRITNRLFIRLVPAIHFLLPVQMRHPTETHKEKINNECPISIPVTNLVFEMDIFAVDICLSGNRKNVDIPFCVELSKRYLCE